MSANGHCIGATTLGFLLLHEAFQGKIEMANCHCGDERLRPLCPTRQQQFQTRGVANTSARPESFMSIS